MMALSVSFSRLLSVMTVCAFARLIPIAPTLAANTLYVSPTGNDDNAGTQAAPYRTIQAAVNNASAGDTVTLEDGTYSGNGNRDIDCSDKPITITSRNGAEKTILDCGGTGDAQHSAFYFHSPPPVRAQKGRQEKAQTVLSGLTIKHGNRAAEIDGSGAIIIGSFHSSVAVRGCILSQNNWGVVANSSPVTVSDCVFSENTEGGALLEGATTEAFHQVSHCVFKANNGPGLSASENHESAVSVRQCAFTGNKWGIMGMFGARDVSDSSFTKNGIKIANHFDGGGLYLDSIDSTVSHCVFAGNVAPNGGGIRAGIGHLIVKGCLFTENTAEKWGGGIYNAAVTASIENCTFRGNSAGLGGGVFNERSATLTSCSFISNTALANGKNGVERTEGLGGGICNVPLLEEAGLVIRHCILSGNIAQGKEAKGGGLENDGRAILVNSIVWGNTAPYASGIAIGTRGEPKTTVTYCDIQGGMGGTGNIKVDPMFVDAIKGDLHLKAGSPCIGTGTLIREATAENPNAPEQVAQGGATPTPTAPAPQNDPSTATVKIDIPAILKDPVGKLGDLFRKTKKPSPKPTAPKPAPQPTPTAPQPSSQPTPPAPLAPDVDPLAVDLDGKPRPKIPSMGAYEGPTK